MFTANKLSLHDLEIFSFEKSSYDQIRILQEDRVQKRIAKILPDAIYFGEHSPVITLGKRTKVEEVCALSGLDIEQRKIRRGGGATYHGPGQLIVYPVIHLADRRMGIRRFVEGGLFCIQDTLRSFGISSSVSFNPAGIWITERQNSIVLQLKIASVGLEIVRGVTNHGFSLNVNGDLDMFSRFTPCGVPGLKVTSMASYLNTYNLSFERVKSSLSESFIRWLSNI